MSSHKQIFKNVLCIIIGVFVVLGITMPVEAQFNLTQEEKSYIEYKKTIRVASSEGTAPFQYTDKKGEVKGISKRVLSEISEMTGLTFHLELYDSIEEIFKSNYDMIVGISPTYASGDLNLSEPYLKTETILYMNTSIDINELENKTYAAIEGGSLPEGIKEENVIYYKTREESIDAVDARKADYGYANAYSVTYYTLQNGYKNIVTLPKGKEPREYSMGIPKENTILSSIINKSLEAIDEQMMENLILLGTSQMDRKITFLMVVSNYGKEMALVTFLVIGILLLGAIVNIRSKNKLSLQNERYQRLSDISNEYLYEYYVHDGQLELSKESLHLFGTKENISEVKTILKKDLSSRDLEEKIKEISLPLGGGESGIFRAVSSRIFNNKGKVHSIIGKLTNISEEVAEKKELITQTQVDGLTDLYNATTTNRLIVESMKDRKEDQVDALMIIDLDNFKEINDTFGHLKGDEVLMSLSTALKDTFRETDIIGRIGGDEFCVYAKDIHSIEVAKSRYEQLSRLIEGINGDLPISVSAGIAQLKDESTYETLFKQADDALYESKEKGKAQVRIYGKQ